MNVIDSLKSYSVSDIQDYCAKNVINASVAMVNIDGDFNFSTMVRNANFFGFKSVYHIAPRKKWDKRGSVGTHHYTPVFHFDTFENFTTQMCHASIIAVENNIPEFADKTTDLYNYTDTNNETVFVFGSETSGLDNSVLEKVDRIITIPGYGSVRSLNVGTTSGIVMSWYRHLSSCA